MPLRGMLTPCRALRRLHVHTVHTPCVVCSGATAGQPRPMQSQRGASSSFVEAAAPNADPLSTLPSWSSLSSPSVSSLSEAECEPLTSSLSLLEMREIDMRRWVNMKMGTSGRSSPSTAAPSTPPEWEALWRSFLRAKEPLAPAEYDTLCSYLLTFVPEDSSALSVDAKARKQPVGQRSGPTASESVAPAASAGTDPRYAETHEPDPRAAVVHTSVAVTLRDPDDPKQRAFTTALRSFLAVLAQPLVGLADLVFVCCGTALGLRRERGFIAHDDDIDLGIMYDALERLPTRRDPRAKNDASAAWDANRQGSRTATEALNALIAAAMSTSPPTSAAPSSSSFDSEWVLLDVCGEVEKGCEVRFQHVPTRVRVDFNVYYPPRPDDGPDSNFVWCATHYENSASRRHQMYRYRNSPIVPTAERWTISLPGKPDSSVVSVLVPSEAYLTECYGVDWKVPKRFTYSEGLREGHYRNLISE